MAYSVEMPELGESVTEGTVTQWLKKVGDEVAVDEPLLEVSTDKVDTEIPSPAAGVLLKILVEEDETVDVGAVIAEIGEEGEEPSGDDSSSKDDADDSDESDDAADKDDEKDADEDEKSDKAEKSDKSEKKSGSSSKGEAEDVTMPELGESVTEGTITQWLKKVGDEVEVDEPLLEVSTDKVDTEIPSPVAGTLVEILAEEDDTVDVGEVIARIGDADAASSSDDSDDDKDADKSETKDEKKSSDEDEKSDKAEKSDKSEKKSGSSSKGEAEDVTMPELGESVTEGTITQWLKKVGDEVEVDEPLLEVSTDKVDTEIPSPVAGTLVEILAEEDDTVDVGEVIARIGDADAASSSDDADDSDDSADEDDKDKASDKSEEKAEKKSSDEDDKADKAEKSEKKAEKNEDSEAAKEVTSSEKPSEVEDKSGKTEPGHGSSSEPSEGNLPYVTPLVRKLADKHNVDLSTIEGTGVGGRIRKQDVLAAAEGGQQGGSAAKTATDNSPAAKAAAAAGPRASSFKVDPDKQGLRGTTKRVNRIREITAKTTLESLHSAAQLTQVHEVDMTRVSELRKENKKAFADKHGVNLTYLPFFAKAIVEALVTHPNVNASYDAGTKEMTYHGKVNLGIAVDTKDGLLSPVIHDAQDMSLVELAKAIVDIADRARNKKLKPHDLSGGTFTISNIGSEGALTDTCILVPPQAAMIGTGAIVKRPVVLSEDNGEAIGIRDMVYLPITYDHQVIDGADAGRFMSTVRDRLENIDFTEDLELS
ncbi:2-oxoglutarate dehydrogenase, E2 component, dihydrolipoamide succinyltransferase [Corynebacterium falsenii]|uniref:Dihydrolipoamide acetyltransferase component of pyruvate dehydrogenase complex n=1 Tax=Corynebacterium falsenii TaxID=108486 RepID=A0A418Q7J2_9CORY|nr:2-oxoglutarate dehydrogenase, E2 component, dihydrolipoamide succinyltransferase [Corynebacterium falsenii]RIX35229.1 2-oxoglutarate dehydrogenase, E2 component, dihydrolipoamide succinyltransferase [Corynebacterium falsenii]